MVVDYIHRISVTKTYLDFLRNNSLRNYNDLLERNFDNDDLVFKLTLIHPLFIKSIHLPEHITHEMLIRQIQGNRSFVRENGKCQAKLIWGYECNTEYEFCHGDHLFPFSLGGPTISGNKLLLCNYHNMVKGTDIHLLPWEDENRFLWIDEHLSNLKNKLSIYL
jgi:hypothetical protein